MNPRRFFSLAVSCAVVLSAVACATSSSDDVGAPLTNQNTKKDSGTGGTKVDAGTQPKADAAPVETPDSAVEPFDAGGIDPIEPDASTGGAPMCSSDFIRTIGNVTLCVAGGTSFCRSVASCADCAEGPDLLAGRLFGECCLDSVTSKTCVTKFN